MVITFVIIAAVLVVLGLFIRKGKGLMLLAGYNTMGEEARAKVDKDKLAKTAGSLLIRLGLEFLLMGVAFYYDIGMLGGIMLAVFIADVFITLFVMNRGAAKAATFRGGMIALAVIVVVVLIGMGAMFYAGELDPAVSIEDGNIQISGMYGTDIPVADVVSLSLDERSMDEIAPDMKRTNGYAGFGDALKGNFDLPDLGPILLYVQKNSAPTIVLERKGAKPVYISDKVPADTQALYGQLQAAIDGM